MTALTLEVRTPRGVVLEQGIAGVVAEDRSGWFGVRPGREDVVAVLPAGLLVLRDDVGAAYVAIDGGVLELCGGRCLVLTPRAEVSRRLEDVADAVAARELRRHAAARTHRDVIGDLAREVVQRLARGARP